MQHVFEAHQRNPKKKFHESLLKSENILENKANASNPFPCFDKDNSREPISPTQSRKSEIASNLVNRDIYKNQTAQINLSNNFKLLQNTLNLNLSSNNSLSDLLNLAYPTPQLHASGVFAHNSSMEKTVKLNLPNQRNN